MILNPQNVYQELQPCLAWKEHSKVSFLYVAGSDEISWQYSEVNPSHPH